MTASHNFILSFHIKISQFEAEEILKLWIKFLNKNHKFNAQCETGFWSQRKSWKKSFKQCNILNKEQTLDVTSRRRFNSDFVVRGNRIRIILSKRSRKNGYSIYQIFETQRRTQAKLWRFQYCIGKSSSRKNSSRVRPSKLSNKNLCPRVEHEAFYGLSVPNTKLILCSKLSGESSDAAHEKNIGSEGWLGQRFSNR